MSVGGLCHWRRAGSLHRCVIGVALENSKSDDIIGNEAAVRYRRVLGALCAL